ncbi:hypothetical protein AQ611_12250 [Burkholderia singularis]|nr:hypothetical protein AQ611_12250 [Burkholderia sp. Bp7605]
MTAAKSRGDSRVLPRFADECGARSTPIDAHERNRRGGARFAAQRIWREPVDAVARSHSREVRRASRGTDGAPAHRVVFAAGGMP